MRDLTMVVGQLSPAVNDIDSNVAKAIDFVRRNRSADLCILPECFVTGYPFEDLAFRPGFVARAKSGLDAILAELADLGGPSLVVGLPMAGPGRPYNAAVLARPSGSVQIAHKSDLPNIGVFDEWRQFTVGAPRAPFDLDGLRIGVAICEEMWHGPAIRHMSDELCDLVVVVNGSPFERGKQALRHRHAAERTRQARCPLVYANMVGGQDELVFDGASFAMDRDGVIVAQAAAFREDEMHLALSSSGNLHAPFFSTRRYPEDLEATYAALVLGTRDYVSRNGFSGVVLGESGGVDSALVTAIATDALGAGNVHAVTMPSRHNGPEGVADALEAASLNGVECSTVSIEDIRLSFGSALRPAFRGTAADVTEENVQARIRGTLLMALSNKFGWLLLSTGNKSEMSVGYATLYGDMAGGYNPLKDVFKTDVFALASWRNSSYAALRAEMELKGPAGPAIPEAILTKRPSAELADGQVDEDALGPYPILDALLSGIVEGDLSPAAAAARARSTLRIEPETPVGRSPNLLAHAEFVARLVQRAEHKRRQAPPGPKVSSKNFGRDRRYPITTGGKLW